MTEREPVPPSTVDEPAPMTRKALAAVISTLTLASVWFYVSYVVMDSPLIDAVGETFGGLATVLLLVSIFGAVRRQ